MVIRYESEIHVIKFWVNIPGPGTKFAKQIGKQDRWVSARGQIRPSAKKRVSADAHEVPESDGSMPELFVFFSPPNNFQRIRRLLPR